MNIKKKRDERDERVNEYIENANINKINWDQNKLGPF